MSRLTFILSAKSAKKGGSSVKTCKGSQLIYSGDSTFSHSIRLETGLEKVL